VHANESVLGGIESVLGGIESVLGGLFSSVQPCLPYTAATTLAAHHGPPRCQLVRRRPWPPTTLC
jgi:hypothetical protein